jgi:hypothetical protein
MRSVRVALAVLAWLSFAGCNAILGNEEDYTLVTPDGGSGASGGNAGTAGTSGGSAGAAGSAADSGLSDGGHVCGDGGPEDCLNNIDDDCNGKTDCADPACTTPTTCVPEPVVQGGVLGTFVPAGASCPTGFTARIIRRGLSGDTSCTGCSCVTPVSYCEASGYGHGTGACGTSQYDASKFFSVFSNSCQTMPADAHLYVFSVVTFTSCTAQGTPRVAPAQWTETRTFCAANRVGGGCPAGSRCVASVATSKCTMTAGATACSGNYPAPPTAASGPWYTGSSDTRTCSACQCGFARGPCSGGRIVGYDAWGCTGNAADVGNGSQASVCNVPFAPVSGSGKVVGTPVPQNCDVQSYASGTLSPTGPQTVCCR